MDLMHKVELMVTESVKRIIKERKVAVVFLPSPINQDIAKYQVSFNKIRPFGVDKEKKIEVWNHIILVLDGAHLGGLLEQYEIEKEVKKYCIAEGAKFQGFTIDDIIKDMLEDAADGISELMIEIEK